MGALIFWILIEVCPNHKCHNIITIFKKKFKKDLWKKECGKVLAGSFLRSGADEGLSLQGRAVSEAAEHLLREGGRPGD